MTNGHEKRSRATRKRLLDAAEVLFVERGYHGTSLGSIGRGAGVNTSLIAHHFGSKAGLWQATFQRLMARYFERQLARLEGADGRGIDLLDESMRAYFDFLAGSPQTVRAKAWLFLEGDRKPSDATLTVVEHGLKRLRQGQELGLIRGDLPAEFIWASFVALAEGWFLMREEYADVFQPVLREDQSLDEAFGEAMVALLMGGVVPREES